MRCEFISERDELAGFRQQWDTLLAASDQPALPLTHAWMLAWWDSFSSREKLAIACVYSGADLVAIVPLVKTTVSKLGIPIRTAIGISNKYTPFVDAIWHTRLSDVECGRVLRLVLELISTEVVHFHKLRSSSRFFTPCVANELNDHPIGTQVELSSPYIGLEATWDDYWAGRSRSFRKSIRRRRQALESERDFQIDRISVRSRDEPALQDMIAVTARSWKAGHAEDLVTDAAGREFLLRLVDAFGSRDQVDLFIARLAGIPIAYEFLVGHHDTVFPLRADYDDAYKQLSPGSVLMHHVLKTQFEQKKYRIYDCCADDYTYLKHWTKNCFDHHETYVYGRSIKPRAFHVLKHRVMPLYRQARDSIG